MNTISEYDINGSITETTDAISESYHSDNTYVDNYPNAEYSYYEVTNYSDLNMFE